MERKYNNTFGIGSNTFPYVNGIIWEPVKAEDSTMTIVSNRAGGVSLKSITHDSLDFFLTRKFENVNMDKGLPNRLEDIMESRTEFIINFSKEKVLST